MNAIELWDLYHCGVVDAAFLTSRGYSFFCADCGKPRSPLSGKKCNPCYRNKDNVQTVVDPAKAFNERAYRKTVYRCLDRLATAGEIIQVKRGVYEAAQAKVRIV